MKSKQNKLARFAGIVIGGALVLSALAGSIGLAALTIRWLISLF